MEDITGDKPSESPSSLSDPQAMQAPTPVLTGNVQQFSSNDSTPFGQSGGGKMTYVTGPDGQMYAYEKPRFNLKQFAIGLCIPLLLMGITGLGNAIFDESNDLREPGIRAEPIQMQSVNNTTAYILNIEISDNEILTQCNIETSIMDESYYWCDQRGRDDSHDFTIYKQSQEKEKEVGSYSHSEKQFNFDDGESHEIIKVSYRVADEQEYQDYEDKRDSGNAASDIFAIFCFAAPIVGIGGSIYGFASGKKDLGIGFLASTALLPFAGFGLILFLW